MQYAASMGVGSGGQGGLGPEFWIQQKNVVFRVSSGKKNFTTFDPPGKILEKSLSGSLLEKIFPILMAENSHYNENGIMPSCNGIMPSCKLAVSISSPRYTRQAPTTSSQIVVVCLTTAC